MSMPQVGVRCREEIGSSDFSKRHLFAQRKLDSILSHLADSLGSAGGGRDDVPWNVIGTVAALPNDTACRHDERLEGRQR